LNRYHVLDVDFIIPFEHLEVIAIPASVAERVYRKLTTGNRGSRRGTRLH